MVLVTAPAALAGPDYPPDTSGGGATVSGTVTPTGVSTGGGAGLPATGADVAALLALGAGALALGTGAVVVASRRQHG